MKLKDATNKRMRWAPPQPSGKHLTLTDRDILFFELLNRHGPLPSTYLYELTRHLGRWKNRCQDRLTDLYNGHQDFEQITFLSRPNWQGTYKDRHIIYDLTPYSKAALEGRGIRVIKRKSEHPLHRFMASTVSASLKFQLEAHRHEYHDRNKILVHPKCPPVTKEADYPFSIPVTDTVIEPDDFFALQDGKPVFYAAEYDRKSETIEDGKARTSYGRKLKTYIQAINDRAFTQHLGIPNNIKVLTITNNERHKKNIQAYFLKEIREYPDRILFAHVEGFGYDWCIPPLMLVRFEDASGNAVEL